ncbi:MAG TPA: hypothetical protein VK254_00330 [Candidatus Bathyarchaeia archaeon]|nr:hypothetical protein [Candidatus Bathyarchaeia archaeon]
MQTLKSFFSKPFPRQKYFYLILATVIIAVGLFVRTYHLSSLPPGIYPDEAVNGVDAIKALETGHFRLFYINNYGREGLFMNLIAFGFKLFGANVITLKMWSVFFGTLTILGIILLARELWNTWRAGLIAGFLYATSYWAINFSRISFRANMLPFVLVFSFYFLFRGLRIYPAPIQYKGLNNSKDGRRSRFGVQTLNLIKQFWNWCGANRYFILAGAFFGLGMHTYIAFRIAPAILIALLIALVISKKNFFRTHWKPVAFFVAAMLIVALPMLLTFWFHPEYFDTRAESVFIFSSKVNQGQLGHALWTSTTKTLEMFNVSGDQNWRHNFPGQPELQFFVGIFFLAGILYFFGRFFVLLYQRAKLGKRSDELVVATLLLSWFFLMLLPEMLSYEGLPHSIRAIGALPAAILLATFAIEMLFIFFDRLKIQFAKYFAYIVLIFLILWSGAASIQRYFVDWAEAPQIHLAFSQNFKNIALYLNSLPPNINKYVEANAGGQIMENGLPVSAAVVETLTHDRTPGIEYFRPDFDASLIHSPAKVVLMYYDGVAIAKIKALYPGAYVQKMDPQPGNGTDYFVININ